jgi:hypothetical protein
MPACPLEAGTIATRVTIEAALRISDMAWIVARLLTALVVIALAACGDAGSGSPEPDRQASGSWERLPDPPLSPRVAGLGLWTGEDALIIGGSDANPCPPNAGCPPASRPPLRDGAAFDPRERTWRQIAPAPVGYSFGDGVVVGGTAYILTHGESGRPDAAPAFLAYRSAQDRWQELPLPPGERDRSITATAEEVVAFTGSDEGGEAPDLIFDPATHEWSELPDDPLPRSFDRTIAWSGRALVLFAHEIVRQPGAAEPSLVIAAALDLDTAEWRRLPDSEILGQRARWFEHDGQLILPALGSADGGEVGNWGRPYPYGGILDPQTGEWSDLPGPPRDLDLSSGEDIAGGILAGEEGDYFGYSGWILDAAAGEWIEIPALDDEDALITGRTVAALGRQLLVFGGVRWGGQGLRGELLNEAWIWSPRG